MTNPLAPMPYLDEIKKLKVVVREFPKFHREIYKLWGDDMREFLAEQKVELILCKIPDGRVMVANLDGTFTEQPVRYNYEQVAVFENDADLIVFKLRWS